jgi:hypothetical protein
MATEKLKRNKSQSIDQIPAGVGQFVLRSIYLLILFGIRRNSRRSGRSRLLYLFIRRVKKQILVIIEAYHFCHYIQNVIQHPGVKVNSICRGNYLGSSVWISMQQVNY